MSRGVPTAIELVEAVTEFLRDEVMDESSDRLRFHARVAANVLGIVERELRLGDEVARAHAARLGRLGVADDAELARAIRDGRFDERIDELVAELRAATHDRLLIANPRYLVEGDEPG
jgi:phosphoserine phosphatase